MLQKEKDRGYRDMWRDEYRSLGSLRLCCKRKARGALEKDMTDWLVQSMGEILLNCTVGTGRSYEIHMKVH